MKSPKYSHPVKKCLFKPLPIYSYLSGVYETLIILSSSLSSVQIEMAEELERQEADRKLQAEKLKNKMEVGKYSEKVF